MRLSVAFAAIGLAFEVGIVVPAQADDLSESEGARNEINEIITVLQHARYAVSQTCLSALQDMHTTERQLTELGGQLEEGAGDASQATQSEQSEISVARDVLATDISNANAACRPDAEKNCPVTDDKVGKSSCVALEKLPQARAN